MPHDDFVDPRKPDPRFPNRPTHPDYLVLSELIQQNDIKAQRLGHNPVEMTGVDEGSMMYFLENRIGLFGQLLGVNVSDPRARIAMQALYVDAFVLGREFEKAGDYKGADRD